MPEVWYKNPRRMGLLISQFSLDKHWSLRRAFQGFS